MKHVIQLLNNMDIKIFVNLKLRIVYILIIMSAK